MLPAVVAERLRARGHDVVAVTERSELRSLPDVGVFAAGQAERRAVATESIVDFVAIVDAADLRGGAHFGLLLMDPARYPRGRPRTIGRMVTSLDRPLSEHPGERATSMRHWL